MKKILYSIMALAISAFTLQSCEDVPAPYDIPGEGGNTETPSDVEPVGDGTEANPYNIAAAIAATENLASGETTPNDLYIKGVVTSIKECSAQYGNATFYLGDDISSSKTFYVYRCKGLNNQKIKADDEVQEGDTIIVCGPVTNYNGTIETVQNGAYIYYNSRIGGSTGGGGEVGEAKGDGTLENPYNSVAANALAESLASGAESSNVYIKGKISSIKEEFGTQFGNATFYISDDGTDAGAFYVYRTLYLGNKKYTGGDNIKVGDEVIIYGKVTNYMGNTPETVPNSSYVYSLNGKTGEGGGGDDTPADGAKGDGTLNNPYNSIAANNVASALADGEKTDVVYIKGKVASIREQYGTQFGNATFTISDDGSSNGEFLVYRALYLDNVKYTEGEVLHVGDDVVVCGKLMNYMGNTPETVQGEAYLYSLTCNGGDAGGDNTGGDNTGGDAGGTTDGNSITLVASDLGLDNATEVTTLTLSDGTTLTFDGGGNQNTPKYYNTGKAIRMYPKNSFTVNSSKKIASIEITCDVYNGTTYNASGDLKATPGSTSVSDNIVTFSGVNANKCTVENISTTTGAPSQVRMTKLKVVYAE